MSSGAQTDPARSHSDVFRLGRTCYSMRMQIHVSDHDGGVRLLRIERPPANAINTEFLQALHAAASEAEADAARPRCDRHRHRPLLLGRARHQGDGGEGCGRARQAGRRQGRHLPSVASRQADDRDGRRPRARRRRDPHAGVRLPHRVARCVQDRRHRDGARAAAAERRVPDRALRHPGKARAPRPARRGLVRSRERARGRSGRRGGAARDARGALLRSRGEARRPSHGGLRVPEVSPAGARPTRPSTRPSIPATARS